MTLFAIIGGSGLTTIEGLKILRQQEQQTPYGAPSAPLTIGELSGSQLAFLPRHGIPHRIPPHEINYRANLWALKESGVTDIIAVNAVGGITPAMTPCSLVVPDQIIDYTWGRKHTFFEGDIDRVEHIDFTDPWCNRLRERIISANDTVKFDLIDHGIYGATQGPRLETAAEISRMENDGCDIVGMTGMPEASLARELGLNLACLAIVVNWAAGKSDQSITMDIINENLASGIQKVCKLLEAILKVTGSDPN